MLQVENCGFFFPIAGKFSDKIFQNIICAYKYACLWFIIRNCLQIPTWYCDGENHPISHAASFFIIYDGVSSLY